MTIRSRRSKRKLHPEQEPEPPLHIISKKLRSKLPRRRRCQISPVLIPSMRFSISGVNPRFSVVSVDSSSGSDFVGGEVSCDSNRASTALSGLGRSKSKNRLSSEIEGVRNGDCVDFLRNRRFVKRNENEVEVSQSSCVDSNSSVRERSRSLVLKFRSGKESKNLKENDEVSEACTKSEITCEEQLHVETSKSGNGNLKISSEINRNDVVSVSSGVRATSFEEEKTKCKENRASQLEFSPGSRKNYAGENCADLMAQSIIKQGWNNSGVDSDLNCSEQLRFSCSEDESEYCSSQGTAFSDLHSEIFGECSELEHSDYTPSLFTDSGSQFSQGSVGETPSPTYSLFLQYREQFSTLTSPVIASSVDSLPLKFARLEDLDDEDSYQMLRKRERRQVFLWNYAERYFSTTDIGELVLQQRSQMVHWIVEQCNRKQLLQETMFLGVSLLDRFLSKGYFKAKRNLQIVGIACLTLATRIEENQQYNRVGQKNFYIKSNVYSRCEVVAMEWMVQEVLNFQCFLPTIYSFLWFYLKAANADAVVEKRVKYLAVLALSAHDQLCYWPSTVAAALVILACLEVNQHAIHKVIGIHVRSKDENLHECMESLEWLLRYL
ncbi:cyclin-SDS [Gastrolobium bilobum]|uniref:cyclin-SDS n=1 Tax=Gastrolobium bilobum TaxID=150636 RepID=UPI002AB1B38C|nr:cyclin-SDS [Gastrolobium bilobum]